MTPPEISRAKPAERAKAIATIMLGFAADPLVRWFWPSAEQYLAATPALDAFAGNAVDAGTTFVSNDFAGVALWMPPGVESDEETMGQHMQTSISPAIAEDVFAVFEQMEKFHPEGDVWYLPMIGVDPAYQGLGHGAALMKAALQECDKAGQAAYLESSNPRNISLYQRHGFEVTGEIQIGSSPLITPMFRAAAS